MGQHSIDALVSSRICHDLISPVGAIGNGIELLDSYAARMPEIGLIADSVDNATAKLRIFRICFGHSTNSAMFDTAEAESIATAMLQTARLRLKWRIQSVEFTRENVKLLFLLLLCVETALPVGGEIEIAEHDGTIEIKAKGTRIVIQDIWRILSGETVDAIAPAQVQFPLAYEIGMNLQIGHSDTDMSIRFRR